MVMKPTFFNIRVVSSIMIDQDQLWQQTATIALFAPASIQCPMINKHDGVVVCLGGDSREVR